VNKKTGAGNVDIGAAQAVLNTPREIVRRRQRFAAENLSLIVNRNEVRKGAAYVNRNLHESLHCWIYNIGSKPASARAPQSRNRYNLFT
jgi:hypothetical protein